MPSETSANYDRHLYMENNGFIRFGAELGSLTTLRSTTALNNSQWHHVVGTQGSGGMALYVDGTRVASNSVTQAQTYRGVWHVGGDNLNSWPSAPSSRFFAGLIDEVAVYGTDLSANRVAEHYRAGRTVNVTQATRPSAPVIKTASSGIRGGKSTAVARWAAPTRTGGAAITKYRVRALRLNASNRVVRTYTSAYLGSSRRSLNMPLPRARYRFSVMTWNRVGASAWSAQLQHRQRPLTTCDIFRPPRTLPEIAAAVTTGPLAAEPGPSRTSCTVLRATPNRAATSVTVSPSLITASTA